MEKKIKRNLWNKRKTQDVCSAGFVLALVVNVYTPLNPHSLLLLPLSKITTRIYIYTLFALVKVFINLSNRENIGSTTCRMKSYKKQSYYSIWIWIKGEKTCNFFNLKMQHSVICGNVLRCATKAGSFRKKKKSLRGKKVLFEALPHTDAEGQASRESQSKSSWISSLLLCRFLSGGRCRGVIVWGCIPPEGDRETAAVMKGGKWSLMLTCLIL